jgi:hypothetical protein
MSLMASEMKWRIWRRSGVQRDRLGGRGLGVTRHEFW